MGRVREVAIKREENECKRAMKNQISQKRSKNYDRLSKDKPLETVDEDSDNSPLSQKELLLLLVPKSVVISLRFYEVCFNCSVFGLGIIFFSAGN